jgi:hypothetical protein
VTVPKLVNIVFAPGKWGRVAPNMCLSAILLHTIAYIRLKVGETFHHGQALPNLERSRCQAAPCKFSMIRSTAFSIRVLIRSLV